MTESKHGYRPPNPRPVSRHVPKRLDDPARIPEVLSWVAIYWKRHPTLRLGQVIGNMAGHRDGGYYIEDEELMQKLKKELIDG
jgi:hypothetical protein